MADQKHDRPVGAQGYEQEEQEYVGAQGATEGATAGSIAPDAAIARRWIVDGRVKRCEVGGFLMIRDGANEPPLAYVAWHRDAHLMAAAQELYAALKALTGATLRADNPSDMGVSHDAPEMISARAAIAKAEGR
jgi:hypothetical protein